MNTNARSLCPKIDSLIDNFNQLDCTFGVVTETWLADNPLLESKALDLQDSAGISILYKNRVPNRRGIAHGGVCILSRDSRVKITRLKLHNPAGHKVLGAIAKVKGHTRRFAVIA